MQDVKHWARDFGTLDALQGIIVEARAYLDSAMVARLIKESEG